ncbi:putative interleukin-17 receptor E-like isoform X2 [Kryptolebias marmoratus]|uniref:putative interleukin-17 receptor E-like isoform X2 n=1 Tax=Kryptolebias marmoratus TaxID=37003 RepID=UPI000D53072A|nr:putative interleukin-17 receptor E-like isoform X2 [Kryptolebias marmoratus]
MIIWLTLLVSYSSWNGAAAESTALERIENCHSRCSQGLHCKTKPDYWFPAACKNFPEDLNVPSVFHDIGVSTVMKCEKKQKCSLQLRVKTALQLSELIHGVSICIGSVGMMTNCQNLMFTKTSRKKLSGRSVTVENGCTEVSPNQQVEVTVKTVPSYCGLSWTSSYSTPECTNEDLRKNLPECITGRLAYGVDAKRKELKVDVSDMLEDQDYHLRLCLKDFICTGTGVHTVIKKEQAVKSAVLPYSRLLPCLCIEGWSAVTDAPRVQFCPFKDRQEELWSGIAFDPLEETLIWEPECPITAAVGLCEKREDGSCLDLPHSSQNVSRGKVIFAAVDPHPQLCMKFSVESQSWIRCPFADRLKVWNVVLTRQQGHDELQLLSQTKATFSLGLCVKSAGSSECRTTKTHMVHAEKQKAVDLKVTGLQCGSCLQVKRLDVTYAPTVLHCFNPCFSRSSAAAAPTRDLTWVILTTAVCLSSIIIVTLVLHILLTGHRAFE